MEGLLLLTVFPFSAAFGLEVWLCRLTRKRGRPLRALPLGALAAPAAGIWYEWRLHSFFWDLAALLWVVVALSILLGWVGGWLLERRVSYVPGSHE